MSTSVPTPIHARSPEDKAAICALIREKHPHKIPVVFVHRSPRSGTAGPEVKFIATPGTLLSTLAAQIRAQMETEEDGSLYFYTPSGKVLKQDSVVAELYADHQDPSGFLFIDFSELEYMGTIR